MVESTRFTATVMEGIRKRAIIPLPFRPDELWGPRDVTMSPGPVEIGSEVRVVTAVMVEVGRVLSLLHDPDARSRPAR